MSSSHRLKGSKLSPRKALISMGQSFRKGLSVTMRRIGQLSPTKSGRNIRQKNSSKKMENIWNEDKERNRRVSRGMKGRLGFAPGLIDSRGRKSIIEMVENETNHEEEEARRRDIRNTLTRFESQVESKDDHFMEVWKQRLLLVLEHTFTEIAMMILTIFALYASDLNVMYGKSEGDNSFGTLSFFAMLIFFLEVGVASIVKPKYFLRAFFWLDFVAAISLISDIPWLSVLLLPNGFAAARAGRASRAGTRAGRLVRVIRLIRLTKLIKVRLFYLHANNNNITYTLLTIIRQVLNVAQNDDEQDDEIKQAQKESSNSDNAGAMTNQLTKLTTVKVIVGLLAMLMITPFIDFAPPNNSKVLGLEILRDQIEMVKRNCVDASSDNATTMCAQGNVTKLVSDLTMAYFTTFSSEDAPILYFAVDGEEIFNIERTGEDLTGRECGCGFPVRNDLRLGPTPPPEIELVALDDEESLEYVFS